MNFLEKASPDCACWSTTPATRTPESRDMRRDFAFFWGAERYGLWRVLLLLRSMVLKTISDKPILPGKT